MNSEPGERWKSWHPHRTQIGELGKADLSIAVPRDQVEMSTGFLGST
jgi:hypothetical protein